MSPTRPRLIAHRGYASVAPENTRTAFRAIADGAHPADLVEFDVMPTADGTPVVFHDHRLDSRRPDRSRPLTDASGLVWETPTQTVLGANVLESGEGVPTLADVIECLPPTVGLNVELRNPGSSDVQVGREYAPAEVTDQRDQWDPFVATVLDLLADVDHEVLVSSFFEAALASAREEAPDLPLAVIMYDAIAEGIALAETYDCVAVHPRLNMIRGTPYYEQSRGGVVDPSFGEPVLLDAAADLGCHVNVWTVRTAEEASALADAGVDGLIADSPWVLAGRTATEPP